ncbi:MAG: dihydrodipicolinate synthase family protein [Saprospiraceae bacterium]|nr:dihydrodipicolinate synthase family protein [Saprospiraceae bacterium]
MPSQSLQSDDRNFALDQDYYAARSLNFKTYDLHKWLYVEGNPVGIKSAMEVLGFCTNEVRLPLSYFQHQIMKLKEELLRIKADCIFDCDLTSFYCCN